ncbi:30S ribosomal protein S20 [Candidatus Saccharibacteria bacterium]|nr:30S ribosomal protein S20 [Candidatus Saccharibacteria bacterium]
MPVIKSAKKRVKVATKANVRNAKTKRIMREAVKSFSQALGAGKAADIEKAQRAAVSAIDIAAKKSVIHKNKAARKKAQLATAAKSAGIKLPKTAVKKASPKTSVKKPTVKKPSKK